VRLSWHGIGEEELRAKPVISEKAAKMKPTRPVFERLSEDANEKEVRHKEAVVGAT
jgi:hypothetical protein